jgi:hypothetical protein
MGYDRSPELLVDEKQALLGRIAEAGEWVYLVHDPAVAACRLDVDERGRFRAIDSQSELHPAGSF